MKEGIHFAVALMKHLEKKFGNTLGKPLSELVAEFVVEFYGERNIGILEEELKNQ